MRNRRFLLHSVIARSAMLTEGCAAFFVSCPVSVSLKRKNQAIVDYLMDRGAVPDLKTLAELGRRGRR